MVRDIGRLASAVLAFLFPLVLWANSPARAQGPKRFNDEQIVRVDIKTTDELEALEQSGAVILNCIPGTAPMDVLVTPEQLTRLERLGLPTRVLLDNVQAWVDAERPTAARADPFADFFLDYHEYGDAGTTGTIVWYMNELATRSPALASLIEVGRTFEGRMIWGLRITNDAIAAKPAVLYFGAEHAREWITTTVPTYVATYLLDNYGSDPVVTDLVDNVEFFLIPVFNVDGYIYTWASYRMWRKNRRDNGNGTYGVDLNRNWAEGWGGPGSSGSAGSDTYRGPGAFSEPETQVLRDFFLDHPNVRAQLDIHSYGQIILWPYGYTSALPPDQDVYGEVSLGMQSLIYDVHGRSYNAGPVFSAIYPASGVSLDWTYAQLGILSYSYELRPTSYDGGGFGLPADQIIPNNEEILPAALHLANTDWVRSAIRLAFPNGVPGTILAGVDTIIPVDLIGQSESVVPGSGRLYYRYDAGGTYIETPLSPKGGDSYAAVLPATNCTSTPQFYFSATSDGGTTLTNPSDAGAGVVYSALVTMEPAVFFEEDLSVDPGWVGQGQWAWGQPTGSGGEYGSPDPTGGYTGSNVYGYNLFGDYEDSILPDHLMSLPIDCRGRSDVHLSFWRWLGVEQPAYDHAYVLASNNGTDWVIVWENTTAIADSSWTFQYIDLSAVADGEPTVYLRWTMGPTDGAMRYCGWNIDDIRLDAYECWSAPGDYNGDGDIDTDDHEQFELCYADPADPVGPGCGIFDFDADGNVNCIDWLALRSAWTGAGDPPGFEPCELFGPPTAEPALKNRYVSFIPGGSSGMEQAFRLTIISNPLFPETVGLTFWVARPDADGISRLRCSPGYDHWGFASVAVGSIEIVPGAAYAVEATLNGVEFLGPAMIQTVPVWADVVGIFDDGAWTPPNGIVDILDALAVLDAFQHLAGAPPATWCDVNPDVPDGVIDVMDVMRIVDAFQALPYPFAGPSACP